MIFVRMDSYEFHNVKAEKAKAMMRYQTQQNLKKILYTLEIFVVLVSIPLFFNWFPIAAKLVKNLVYHFFHTTFYVFLLTNVMVFGLAISFYLTREENEANSDIYDEFVNASESSRKFNVNGEFPVPEVKPEEPTICFVDKEIIFSENAAVSATSAAESSVRESKSSVASVECSSAKSDNRAVKREKEFRRSVTAVCRKMEIEKTKRPELRRSKTGNYCRTMRCVDEPPRRSVEEMSSEEFRSEIEKFIAMQKRMQIEEYKSEDHVWTKKTKPSVALISQV